MAGKEEKERVQSSPCSWCTNKTDGVYIQTKNTMTAGGVFADFDWVGMTDIGRLEGIPVCGGCGGLGVQYPTKDFQKRVEEIQKLRFDFADAVYEEQNPKKQLEAIQKLVGKIGGLVEKYGHGKENSFAHAVSEDLLQGRIDYLKGLL